MCKKFKLDHTNKSYMHNPSPVQENDIKAHMGLWYTHGSPNLGQKTKPYNNQQKKKKKRICKIVDFAVPADHRINLKEYERKDKYLDLARKLKRTMENEGDDCANCDWCFWNSKETIIKGPGGLGSWQTSGDHPNDNIIEGGQNTEKSPGDLRRLTVTQTPVKNHQLKMMWKTLKE